MKLRLFRDHLAEELEALPDFRYQEIQSRALTTAILVRAMVERLGIQQLKLEEAGGSPKQSHGLRKILNAIIHYRAFYPYHMRSFDESEDWVVRLYSRESRKKDGFYRIRLQDYFEVVSRFAHDDLFIADHLLKRTNRALHRVMNAEGLDVDDLREAADLIEDGLELTARMDRAGHIDIPSDVGADSYVDVAENPLRDGHTWAVGPKLNAATFVHGFAVDWRFSPFAPGELELPDADAYCMFAEKMDDRPDGRLDSFVVPFRSFIDLFDAVKEQWEAPAVGVRVPDARIVASGR